MARPPRPAFLTRRYETSWLAADGRVETATRIAPALPAFEEAFSAIARGALIETADGLVAVEDLAPGATIITADGRREQVVWMGAMTLFPPQAVPGLAPACLTRITADAFGDGRPMPDLLLGPQARIVLQGARCRRIGTARASVPARSLVDGEGIVAVTPVAPVTVYHLVLSRHAALRCAGVEVESFHPGKDHAERFDPQMAQLFLAMFPTLKSFADFGPLALPRLSADEALDMIAA
ncbi:MAG: Hint domain-containing protein [Proteobacteria bacterium]|nr:Hint domain-containing protein [Pseudomonadota bacterium]MBS0573803.1 Hint domain-containing protein [Pseudomonadota bacterium]